MRTINFAEKKNPHEWLESMNVAGRDAEIGTWQTTHTTLVEKMKKRLEEKVLHLIH